jgi:hypothetical protein
MVNEAGEQRTFATTLTRFREFSAHKDEVNGTKKKTEF